MYDADHQCRLSYGQEATHCADIEGMERVCQTLWCRLNNRCITRMDPAAEGTQCGKHKVSSDSLPATKHTHTHTHTHTYITPHHARTPPFPYQLLGFIVNIKDI